MEKSAVVLAVLVLAGVLFSVFALADSPTGTSGGTCNTLWWFDNTHNICQQKSFCGAYAYEGLKTFTTEDSCQGNLTETCTNKQPPCCNILWWFDSTHNTTCQQKSFCGAYAYQGLKTFATQETCLGNLTNIGLVSCINDTDCVNAGYGAGAICTLGQCEGTGAVCADGQPYCGSECCNSTQTCVSGQCEATGGGTNGETTNGNGGGSNGQSNISSVPFNYTPIIINNTPTCNSGCLYNEKCIPYGYRVRGDYCNIDGNLTAQLASGQCGNSFQCSSNLCVNSECVTQNFIQKIIDFFKNFFGMQ